MNKLISGAVVFAALAGFLVVLGVDSSAQSDSKPKPKVVKPYKFVAPLEVVMEVADEYFYAVEDKLEENKFRTIKKHALVVAEVANMMSTAVGEKDWEKKEWKEYCKVMLESSMKMAEASKKKNAAVIKELFAKIEESCDNCHEMFRDE